ncbi:MAG: 4-hydroxy-tetrahydrodipicolinate synthase [Gemmatimonadota bacterium]
MASSHSSPSSPDPSGLSVALPTPFREDGSPNLEVLARHVEWQIREGVSVLMPCGTTGEGSTLSADEHESVVRCCVEAAAGRVPVYVGVGSSATRVAMDLSRRAAGAGAHGILCGTPPYNRPSQRGLLAHFRAVADAGSVPVVIYNIPSRTGCTILPETILELAEDTPFVGVKESTGQLDSVMALIASRPEGFRVLAGDDWLALPILAAGGDGLVSVTANQIPSDMARLVEASRQGLMAEAREIHYRLLPLFRANFVDSNPVPLKASLALLGRMDERVRLPLVRLAPAQREVLETALRDVGILTWET